ncbi:MAG: SDR family NAD(P)-dependent oxidoreductase [Deltaproteobacteria bacterium]|nr:SDR family NAD(P)-dependent oxidoreductase [Deltaproteobacteria bacterium]
MRILITGASKGLGAALASRYMTDGHTVWGVARSAISSDAVVPDDRFMYTRCDVRDQAQIRKTTRAMMERAFVPDVVVFNAGAATDDATGPVDFQKFKENFDANLFGAMVWVEEFLPLFLKRGSGVFAAISSLSAYRENHKNRVAYSASKLALSKAFENLRLQYRSSGVRFVTFHPGRMSTEKASFIGTTYCDAARIICRATTAARPPSVVNFPALQYYLTRALRFVPDGLFHRFIFR